MKRVVRYLLEGDGTVPKFVDCGGFFPVGEELVGISVDENKRHVPSTVVRLTRDELKSRYADMEPRDIDTNELLTEQQISDAVDAFLDSQGLADYE